MHRLFLFLLLGCKFSSDVVANSIDYNSDLVLKKVQEYASCITRYCNCKGENIYEKQDSIFMLFQPSVDIDDTLYIAEEARHSIELFRGEVGSRLDTYLRLISEAPYFNSIAINFSDFNLYTVEGNTSVFVEAKENMLWNKDSFKTINILIEVSVTGYPYYLKSVKFRAERQIITASNLPKRKNSHPDIFIQAPKNEGKSEVEKKYIYDRSMADDRFSRGYYKKALRGYNNLLRIHPHSAYLKSMINKCESIKEKNYSSLLLSLTYGFPCRLRADKVYHGTVMISYDQRLAGQEATLEINLPFGCTVTSDSSKIKGAECVCDGNKVRFKWQALPGQNPFLIFFKVQLNSGINVMQGKFNGNFSYSMNGELVTHDFENVFY